MRKAALVVGAGGALGEAAAQALLGAGWAVTATMRRERADAAARLEAAGARLEKLDLESPPAALSAPYDAAILTPILSLSVRLAPVLANVARIVAFSSNNVALMPEAPKYRALVRAEAELRESAPHAIVIRPTLIYGDPRLPTFARVMAWARRAPVLPLPGSGRALQQPVFHEDLAALAASLAGAEGHGGATFAVGGPDIVTMGALFAALAAAAGAPRPIAPIPVWALRLASAIAPGLREMQIAEIERDKLAAPVDALPADWTARTGLGAGLARLARALGYAC